MINFCVSFQKIREKMPWYLNKQIEGFVTRYQGGLDFLTIKVYFIKFKNHRNKFNFQGVGHMVPQWKPVQSYHFFSKFLNDESY